MFRWQEKCVEYRVEEVPKTKKVQLTKLLAIILAKQPENDDG